MENKLLNEIREYIEKYENTPMHLMNKRTLHYMKLLFNEVVRKSPDMDTQPLASSQSESSTPKAEKKQCGHCNEIYDKQRHQCPVCHSFSFTFKMGEGGN